MSWTDKLLETYDLCASKVGEGEAEKMLLPIGHLVQNAQIEVVIDLYGNMIDAFTIPEEDSATVIPVSEDSASRSSGISPHPLHDKLIYVAGDYIEYVDDSKGNYHDIYMENLSQWVRSPYSNEIVRAIYAYIAKGTLINDLVKHGLLVIQNDKLDKKVKLQRKINQDDAFIRFRVDDDKKDIMPPWKDKELFQSYIEFFRYIHQSKDICYVSGESVYCTDKHPAKIRYSSDKAKLISSNDSSGFTFRGRFAGKENAASMGYETSQKIHNALRWLIQNQGYQKYGLTVLIWNVESKPVYARALFSGSQKIEISTEESYAENIYKSIKGYKKDISPKDGVIIMTLEAATTGRLSITGYEELQLSRYYKNIEDWYDKCCWAWHSQIRTPFIDQIVNAAYGVLRTTSQGAKKKSEFVADDKVAALQMKRLLPCVLMGKKIPKDIILAVYEQVLTMSKVSQSEWEYCISMLCALARKEKADRLKETERKGEIWTMSIEDNKKNGIENVDYVYGRLLAVYHLIESYANYLSKEDRETNAMKYFVQFKKYPWKTLETISVLAQPYIIKLGNKGNYLVKLKEEISEELMTYTEARMRRNLTYDFVIGFDCQKLEHERKMKNYAKIEENEEEQ